MSPYLVICIANALLYKPFLEGYVCYGSIGDHLYLKLLFIIILSVFGLIADISSDTDPFNFGALSRHTSVQVRLSAPSRRVLLSCLARNASAPSFAARI